MKQCILAKENWSADLNDTFTFASDEKPTSDLSTEGLSYSKKSLLFADKKPIGRMYTVLEIVDHEKDQKAAILRFSLKGHAEGSESKYCFDQIKTSNQLINDAFVVSTTEKARKTKWGQT